MTTDTFRYAGVSTLKDECKVRYANDAMRVKVLAKNGHSSIDLIELKVAMTKEDAVAFLLSIDFDNGNAVVRSTLEAELAKRTVVAVTTITSPTPVKAAKAPKAPAAPADITIAKPKKPVGPTVAGIQAKAAAKIAADKAVRADEAAGAAAAAAMVDALGNDPF